MGASADGLPRRKYASNGWWAEILTTSSVATFTMKRPASVKMVPPSRSQIRQFSSLTYSVPVAASPGTARLFDDRVVLRPERDPSVSGLGGVPSTDPLGLRRPCRTRQQPPMRAVRCSDSPKADPSQPKGEVR